MDLDIRVMSKNDTIASILKFQTEDTTEYWRSQLFNVYPWLDKGRCSSLALEDRKEYLISELSAYYDKIQLNLQNKLSMSQNVWLENKENVNDIYSKVFDIDCHNILSNIMAEISLNPICPRNLKHVSFSFFWGADNNNFMKTALHEMIHFVWFHIWQKYFTDNEKEYESPSLKWILSEMVIDTFVRKTEIGVLYPEPYKQQPAYRYFYEMIVHKTPILVLLSNIKEESSSIRQFMEGAYQFCLENEVVIREQLR